MDETQRDSEDDFQVSEDWERAPKKSDRMPLKHKLADMAASKNALVREWALGQVRSYKREEQRRRTNEAAFKREKRAEARWAPALAIKREASERLKVLHRATKHRRGDKFLEQLSGREEELTAFWSIGQFLELQLGRVPSDAELGAAFAQFQDLPEALTKSQARSRRQKVEKLEQHPQIWLPFRNRAQSGGSSTA